MTAARAIDVIFIVVIVGFDVVDDCDKMTKLFCYWFYDNKEKEK